MQSSFRSRTDLDVLRIFACTAVIVLHALIIFSFEETYHLKSKETSHLATFLMDALRGTSMPLFFIIAGYAALSSLRTRDVATFAKERSKRLLVWSAGCSTGEEAYTLAALILESDRFNGWDVRVIGSDLSKQCVAHARRAVYQAGSLRATSARDKARYFQELGDGFHVDESVKKLCQFGQMNLFDAGRGNLVGRVDAIFCRNVLIYFDVRSRKRVIDHLYQRLSPGGYLMLGHSESLLNLSTAFELVHLRDDLVYRKPLGAGGGY
jgi:chemotaxis methyl-accepting protein methylase